MRRIVRRFKRSSYLTKVMTLVAVFVLVTLSIATLIGTQEAQGHKVHVHEELSVKSLETLYNDNKSYIPEWLDDMELQKYLREGARDADMMDMSRNHYYNPYTDEGLSEFKSAKTRFVEKVYDSRDNLEKGEMEEAMIDLGWSLHMLHDMTIPHHTHLEESDGHSDYESWIADNMRVGHVVSGGNYSEFGEDIDPIHPERLLHDTAMESYDYYEYVADSENASEENYTYAWENLQPLAIRQGAGFLHWFFNTYIEDDFHVSVVGRAENSLSIRWRSDFAENFSHYEIYIAENETALEEKIDKNQPRTNISVRDLNSYTISGLDDFTEYNIRVKVVRDGQEDTLSEMRTSSTIMSTTKIAVMVLALIVFISLGLLYKRDYHDGGKKRERR